MDNLPKVTLQRQNDTAHVNFSGTWSMHVTLAEQDINEQSVAGQSEDKEQVDYDINSLFETLKDPSINQIHLQCDGLYKWDSSLLVVLVRIVRYANDHGLKVNKQGLPIGLQELLRMAFAVPAQKDAAKKRKKLNILEKIGDAVLKFPAKLNDVLEFIGDVCLSLGRFFRGKADIRSQDVVGAMQECGMEALPIISITTLLFGLILAFVGAVQLTQFGAQIYVAGLVGIGILRVMGAVMVGVVMSGRMGAAYAALIGTMQVNEEIDALYPFGISSIDFLVLPRILALTLMTPLLTLYADLMGLVGGFLVGVFMLDIAPMEYINATAEMVPFKHLVIGLWYGTVFGVIIAMAGCYHGIRCGRSAEAVGKSTTEAVVTSIVGIIIATAVITVLCDVLKI